MSKKTEYHIVELYCGRSPGVPPRYYLWRTGAKRGPLLSPEFKLYDTYEEAVAARCRECERNDSKVANAGD